MAFYTSANIFDEVFNQPSPSKNVFKVFLDGLVEYLESRKDEKLAGEMLASIQKGDSLAKMTVRPDVMSEFASELRINQIPYVIVTEERGKSAVMIRKQDKKGAASARDVALQHKAACFILMPLEEMKALLLQERVQDRELVSIGGLTKEEAESVLMHMQDVYEGEYVGYDITGADNTIVLSFIGKLLFKKKQHRRTPACMIIVALLSLSGENRVINYQRVQNKIAFERGIANNFRQRGYNLRDTPAWILGDNTRYIKISADGYEAGYASMSEGRVTLHKEGSASIGDVDFLKKRASEISGIPHPFYTYDARMALNHLQMASSGELKSSYLYTESIARVNQTEQRLAATLDTIVLRKIMADTIMQMGGKWNEKLSHYGHETAKLLTGVLSDKIPDGYKQEDLHMLQDIMDLGRIDIMAYQAAISRIGGLETDMTRAETKRLASLGRADMSQEPVLGNEKETSYER